MEAVLTIGHSSANGKTLGTARRFANASIRKQNHEHSKAAVQGIEHNDPRAGQKHGFPVCIEAVLSFGKQRTNCEQRVGLRTRAYVLRATHPRKEKRFNHCTRSSGEAESTNVTAFAVGDCCHNGKMNGTTHLELHVTFSAGHVEGALKRRDAISHSGSVAAAQLVALVYLLLPGDRREWVGAPRGFGGREGKESTFRVKWCSARTIDGR